MNRYLLIVAILSVNFPFTGDKFPDQPDKPRMAYVVYGHFCGECAYDCTRMYKHYLLGNTSTFWTDSTDSYFSDEGLRFDKKMPRKADPIGFGFIRSMPDSILLSKNETNVFGCPDCDDGCGLYLEFRLDEAHSKRIIYRMPYDLNGTSGQVRSLGRMVSNTIDKLEAYR